MKYVVGLFATGFALAVSGWAADVPDYHERIIRQLDEMLDRTEAENRTTVREPVPADRRSGPRDLDGAIRNFAERYWKGREDLVRAALERIEKLRPSLEPLLLSEGVPAELAAVVLVESAAQPFALSPKQARGLWQFIPATAERYGLEVSARIDHRVHVQHSTQAAARYLRELFQQFGDWRLALAAYNAGEGAVARAIAKGRTSDFDVLSAKRLLPAETRAYVPAVLDAIELLGGSKLFLLGPPTETLQTVARGSS